MFYLAAIVFAITCLIVCRALIGSRLIRRLAEVPDHFEQPDSNWPLVSVVVAARNEERDFESGLRSLLSIDYPNLQLIAVNDRSTDSTGSILDRLAEQDTRLEAVHVVELPRGWLGKNHALHIGAGAATGEYLLFTDADVLFEPSTLRRAIVYMTAHDVDHLAATPQTLMPGSILSSFATSFTICFAAYFPPWQVRDPTSRTAIGIGAFNLVRRAAYLEIGGHERLRMRPDDDVKLGKVLKQSGFRQDIVSGNGVVRVPWYRSVREVVVGLEKNTFAGVDYSVTLTVLGSVGLITFNVLPFVGVFLFTGLTAWVCVLQCILLWAFAAWVTTLVGVPMRSCFWHPVTMSLIAWIMWRTMILTFRHGGISWRGTHYPLSELRANVV